MNYMFENTHKDNREWVLGLLVECPLGEALENCPLKVLRALPLQEKIVLSQQMDDSKLDDIISFHKRCLKKREGVKPQEHR